MQDLPENSCAVGAARGRPAVSQATRALLEKALRTGRFGALVFAPAEAAEAGAVLDPAIAAHLSRPLKSLDFLKEMGG